MVTYSERRYSLYRRLALPTFGRLYGRELEGHRGTLPLVQALRIRGPSLSVARGMPAGLLGGDGTAELGGRAPAQQGGRQQ